MADAVTPNFDFILPEVGGSNNTWGEKLNANFSQIDTILAGASPDAERLGGQLPAFYTDAANISGTFGALSVGGNADVAGNVTAGGNMYAGIFASDGPDARAMVIYGNSGVSKYLIWSPIAGGQRGYVGYGSNDDVFHIVNSVGTIKILVGTTTTVTFTSNGANLSGMFKATGTATDNDHTLIGQSGKAGIAGVAGFSSSAGIYALLGYDGYAFRGVGAFYLAGSAQLSGGLQLNGNIVDNSGTLVVGVGTGNLYGSTWGGYLSSYMDSRYTLNSAAYGALGSVQRLKIVYTAVNIAPGGTASGSLLSNSDGTAMSGVWMNVDYDHALNNTTVLWRKIG